MGELISVLKKIIAVKKEKMMGEFIEINIEGIKSEIDSAIAKLGNMEGELDSQRDSIQSALDAVESAQIRASDANTMINHLESVDEAIAEADSQAQEHNVSFYD